MGLKLSSLCFSLGFLALLIFTASLFSPAPVLALSQSSISVVVTPENPGPGDNVDITLSSFAADLDNVLITWSIDGKKSLSGIGEKSFSVTAPNAGSEMNVVATLGLPEGVLSTKIIIRPAETVLLWQATDSYVPPFYKGKALPTPDSSVKVVAMPEIRSGSQAIDAKKLVYDWQLDYSNDPSASGYGKNAYTYVNDYLDNSNNISVTASTTDQKRSASASLDIITYLPKILFYKNDATLGTVWEKAIGSGHKIAGNEILEAAPYFISPKDIRIPVLSWNWFINDNLVSGTGTKKNLIPLKVEEGVSGTSKIRLEINNNLKIFDKASKEISVEF